jgi:tRNA (guanine-N7-)-methyltransferase
MPRITPEEARLRLDPTACRRKIDWQAVFGRTGRVEVEIGIGLGRFLLRAAKNHPEINYLGVEWANAYLRRAIERAAKRELGNIRFLRIDAAHLIAKGIPDNSVDTYYVFYPDPWPKRNHHKRRFLQQKNAVHLIRTLKMGGMLHVATDHDVYWDYIQEEFAPLTDLERMPEFGGPDFPQPVEEQLTNFETKYEPEGRSRHRASWKLVGKSRAARRVEIPEAHI